MPDGDSHATPAAPPRRRGRPRIGRKIQVVIPDDLLTDIDNEANRTGRDRSEEIRRRLSAFQR